MIISIKEFVNIIYSLFDNHFAMTQKRGRTSWAIVILNSLNISHLLFVDNILIFCDGSVWD